MSDEKKEQKVEQVEIPVNVLIIAHKQSQFAAAASFLTRRGFPCTVKGNIRDGLQFITKNKATHVFLSWNLPGANIIKTYQLIAKTFKVDCVVYAEKADGKTAAELTMSRLPEVMQAPVSGPGLYMRIQKLIKQKEEGPSTPSAEKKTVAQQQKSKTITLKCSNKDVPTEGTWESAGVDPADGQPIYRFKSSNPNQKNKNSYTFKGPKPPELGEDGTWGGGSGVFEKETEEDSSSNIINFQKSGAKYNEQDYEDQNNDDTLNDISDLLDNADLGNIDGVTQDGETSSEEQHTEANSLSAEELHADLDAQNSEEHSSNDGSESNGTPGSWKSKRSQPKEKSYGSVLNVAKKVEKKEADLPEYQTTAPKEALVVNVEPKVKSNGPASILAEKVLEAIKNSTKPSQKIDNKIEKLNEAKAFTIHSPRFHGYLLLASANKIILNEETFQNIKEHLMILLDKVGEKLLNLEELDLNLNGMEFNVWAEEHAEFVVSSCHEGNEICCAFISTPNTLPKIKENQDPKMVTIGVKDIEADTKSKFDLFLHLPKNNKYIRYLRPGDTINSKHIEKFESHKLEDLHIKKEELKSFKEYFASNKLNTLQSASKKKAS